MNDIKMLVLDIDGTLTNSQKEITEETKRAINLIQERGHKVMLASGRPTPGMKRYAEELELEKYGGHVESQEIGLPVTQTGLVLPCGASGRWCKD